MSREWYEFFQVASGRLGITRDRIAGAETAAQTAQSQAAAVSSGAASTPYSLDPANPITTRVITVNTFAADIAQHVRTEGGSGSTIPAGTVTNLQRGVSHLIYYDTPGTYLASSGVVDFTVAGRKLVGAAYLADDDRFSGGGFGGGYEP